MRGLILSAGIAAGAVTGDIFAIVKFESTNAGPGGVSEPGNMSTNWSQPLNASAFSTLNISNTTGALWPMSSSDGDRNYQLRNIMSTAMAAVTFAVILYVSGPMHIAQHLLISMLGSLRAQGMTWGAIMLENVQCLILTVLALVMNLINTISNFALLAKITDHDKAIETLQQLSLSFNKVLDSQTKVFQTVEENGRTELARRNEVLETIKAYVEEIGGLPQRFNAATERISSLEHKLGVAEAKSINLEQQVSDVKAQNKVLEQKVRARDEHSSELSESPSNKIS